MDLQIWPLLAANFLTLWVWEVVYDGAVRNDEDSIYWQVHRVCTGLMQDAQCTIHMHYAGNICEQRGEGQQGSVQSRNPTEVKAAPPDHFYTLT